VYNLHLVAKEFNMGISITKTKIMAVTRKICTENTIFEQVNNFNYLGYNLTYKGKLYNENKL
jgi:hypothetical protein